MRKPQAVACSLKEMVVLYRALVRILLAGVALSVLSESSLHADSCEAIEKDLNHARAYRHEIRRDLTQRQSFLRDAERRLREAPASHRSGIEIAIASHEREIHYAQRKLDDLEIAIEIYERELRECLEKARQDPRNLAARADELPQNVDGRPGQQPPQPINVLDRSNMTTLGAVAAIELSQHQGDLVLNGLESLSDRAANALAKHKGTLHLNGLCSLSRYAARALAGHDGDLCLNGVTTLSDESAVWLAKHKGKLHLSGLEKISDVALAALRTHPDVMLPNRFK